MAGPNLAHAQNFKHSIEQPITSPIKITVLLSEDMQYRANNLPKSRNRSRGVANFRNGFSNHGYYGEKTLAELSQSLKTKVESRFKSKGITVAEEAPLTLKITIEDARNNRPTFTQLSNQANLSFQSFGLGGAKLTAELTDASGTSLGTMSYRYYESNLFRFNSSTAGIWQDARRSFSRFASHAAKTLKPKTVSS